MAPVKVLATLPRLTEFSSPSFLCPLSSSPKKLGLFVCVEDVMSSIQYNTELLKQQLLQAQIDNEERKTRILKTIQAYWDNKLEKLRRS